MSRLIKLYYTTIYDIYALNNNNYTNKLIFITKIKHFVHIILQILKHIDNYQYK